MKHGGGNIICGGSWNSPKPESSGEDLYGWVGQNPCCNVCKPVPELQETSDLCNCKQRFLYQISSSIFYCIKYLFHAIKWKLFKNHTMWFFWTVEVYLRWKWQISPFFVCGNLEKSAVYQILICPTVYGVFTFGALLLCFILITA